MTSPGAQRETADCVVLGGGPAGSTFASTLTKYAPGLRTILLERERFPRWQIGESTVAPVNRIFTELDLLESLESGDFVSKAGGTMVWGPHRRPWSVDYLEVDHHGGPGGEIDIRGHDYSPVLGPGVHTDEPLRSFNVLRSRFDELLLNRSKAGGVEVREGTLAHTIDSSRAGDTHVVRWRDDKGRSGEIETPFVLDACGRRSPLTRGRRVRDLDMANFSVFGYLSGARRRVSVHGKHDRAVIFVCTVPDGWIWYIPVDRDLISVGLVTSLDHARTRLRDRDPEGLLLDTLAACEELRDHVADATLRADILGGGARVRSCQDWASWAASPVGPGWAAAGDAAAFVDPIVPVGVSLAIQSGHRAAYTLLTQHRRPSLDADALWRAYANYQLGEAGAFDRLARFFYGNNRAMQSPWWLARPKTGLGLDSERYTMLSASSFFPVSSLAYGVTAPLIMGLTGTQANLMPIYRELGLPPPDRLRDFRMATRGPFELALCTGYPTERRGELACRHDLVTSDPQLYHRMNAVPADIDPRFSALVDAMAQHSEVESFLAVAPELLEGPQELGRASAAEIVQIAALKGFIELRPR